MSNLGMRVEDVHHSKVHQATPGTVIITIVCAKDIETSKKVIPLSNKKIILELSNETNKQQNQSSLHVKKLEGTIGDHGAHRVEWNERFYYNSIEMVDDNITFTLRE